MAESVEHLRMIVDTMLQRQQDWVEKLFSKQAQQQQELLERFSAHNLGGNNESSERLNVSVPPFRAYDNQKDRWDTYLVCLNQHFEAHNVTSEEQKRAYFLSWVGTYIYDLLIKLFADKDPPGKQKYSDLVKYLSDLFVSKTHVLAARYNFFSAKMKPEQTYADWVADLRGIARDCKFICSSQNCQQSFVDSLIRDTIVLHTPHDQVRASALQHVNPSLDVVMKIAEAYETTQRTVQAIKGQIPPPEVHQVKFPSRSRSKTRKPQNSGNSNQVKSCPECWKDHVRSECKFRKAKCNRCHKVGHIASVCLTKPQRPASERCSKPTSGSVDKSKSRAGESSKTVYETVSTSSQQQNKYFATLKINGTEISFQIDTGATCSMIDLKSYAELGSPECAPSTQVLSAYGNTPVPLRGSLKVVAEFQNKRLTLPLLVTETPNGGNLLGVDWFTAFNFHIEVNEVRLTMPKSPSELQSSMISTLCEKYQDIFQPGLGTCTSMKVSMHLKPGATPKFFKPRPIPFSQQQAVNKEIQRLSEAGIWKSVPTSQWAAPIVVVPKPNGKVRICGDFKVTVNPQIEIDQYPLPRPEEILQKLKGGQTFSKIDLADAYLQLELDDEAKKLLVVNTPQGLFEYQRLPFGVASAPAIYQRFLEQLIVDIPGCANYLDDIIITGKNDEEHKQNLDALLKRLQQSGLKCNREKCNFFQSEIEYLGNVIDAEGMRPSQAGTEAIKKLPRPKNVQELHSFLGKVNYYNKFIKGFSQIAEPLHALRRKNAKFVWNKEQESAFQELKNRIVTATSIVHFNPDYSVVLATDASSYGIGAVLSHITPDGSEKPIAFASKTLSDQQRRYSAIEKEGLAIVYGVKKFHQYLYGREFELVTDNKPLMAIFHPSKALPVMTAQRLQRWAMLLMGYNYKIRFRRSGKHANADALSRLPAGPDEDFDKSEESCMQVDLETDADLESFPIDSKRVCAELHKDQVLSQVMHYVESGWPERLSPQEAHLEPYFQRRSALSLMSGLLLLHVDSPRVVVPASLQKQVLKLLHEGHWGIVRTKQLARRYCWWPRIDKHIEDMVRTCEPCQQVRALPKEEFCSWPEATKPWERVHVDMTGPFWNSTWLVLTDAFSHFPYIVELHSIKTAPIIDALRRVFVIEGLPEAIVTDNAAQFHSQEFQQFCVQLGIRHVTIPPFHPASNGMAERQVRTFKEAMRKEQLAGEKKDRALQKLLASYRATPNPVTGFSPAELLHGRQPRNMLSLLFPSLAKETLPEAPSQRGPIRSGYAPDALVFARNYGPGLKWVPGRVIKKLGNIIYLVETDKGQWKRHLNQLRSRLPSDSSSFRGRLHRDLSSAADAEATSTSELQAAQRQACLFPGAPAKRASMVHFAV